MDYQWYEVVWPWVGLGGALALTVLLFFTDYLQRNKTVPKWKDVTWIAWLSTIAYLVHNVEEYGIDIYGNLYAFPECFKAIMVGSGKEMPGSFFMGINLPAFWITFPAVSALSKKYPWLAFLLPAGLFTNAISHIIPIIAGVGYTPGTLTAIVLFLPISIWSGIAFFGKGKYQYKWMAVCIAIFLFAYVCLLGSAKLYIYGVISAPILIALQIMNGPICFVLAYLSSKGGKGSIIQLRS